MSPRSLSSLWTRLDVTRKWILFSCVLIALSTVLPWYADLDSFGAGDFYLGLTGPLFLVGLLILGSAVFTLSWILLPLFGKRLPTLPLNEATMYVFLAFQDLILLLIANSIFFHPKFGVNITLKETGFGMILAFIGVLLLLWSSIRLWKRTSRREMEHHETPAASPRLDTAPAYRPTERFLGASPIRREPIERSPQEEDRPGPQPLRMDL